MEEIVNTKNVPLGETIKGKINLFRKFGTGLYKTLYSGKFLPKESNRKK
jgi:hypothetical protein